jgi:preprotein translocase subunit SecG
MSRNRRKQTLSDVVKSPASTLRRRKWVMAGIFVLASICVALILASWFQNKDMAAASSPAPRRQSAHAAPATASQGLLPDTERRKLIGRWRRTDANYVLEINRVTPDGQIDAAYLNPKPIHVSKAIATSESGKVKIMIELRDRLYPGSYYTLTYDSGDDRLSGVYHHLGVNQEYDVVFVRVERN